jgi:hypothetical protein
MSHPHVTWFTRSIFDCTGFSNEMHTIHLMQPSFALKVYLHALVKNADFPSDVTYLAIFIIVQSTYSNILLCKMAVPSKWIWTEEISKQQQQTTTTIP